MNGYVRVDDHSADEVHRRPRHVAFACFGVLSLTVVAWLGTDLRLNAGASNLASLMPSGLRPRQVGSRQGQQPGFRPMSASSRDEEWKAQQEIIARRRNKQSNEEYFSKVKQQRSESYKRFMDKKIKYKEGEDNLEQWKKLNPEGYNPKKEYDEPSGSVPIPLVSFGMPKYDEGERFDLRLPYVDNGYVAEDGLDAWSRFQGLFDGFGKKNGREAEEAYNERAARAAEKRRKGGGLFGFGKKEEPTEPPADEGKKGWFR